MINPPTAASFSFINSSINGASPTAGITPMFIIAAQELKYLFIDNLSFSNFEYIGYNPFVFTYGAKPLA